MDNATKDQILDRFEAAVRELAAAAAALKAAGVSYDELETICAPLTEELDKVFSDE